MLERGWLIEAGRMGYLEACQLQKRLAAEVIQGERGDTLILTEHPPLLTIGAAGDRGNILASPQALAQAGIEIYSADRGGDVAYHGPGQLVGYPVLHLDRHGKDVKDYLRRLEEVLIRTLAGFGLAGHRAPGYTGVWVADAKIAAIGIGVKKWVTFHGFALNVDPDLSHFSLIHPCGIRDKRVTSLAELLPQAPDWREVSARVAVHFAQVFNLAVIGDKIRSRGEKE
ncbi:MAG: lipoyl(octanoyl) transferase LipB [Syntrophomonadaceae bacterium]|nr:lipoyl(octanoyl) transferase LipB [Syntrophomonadaceae bacterium]